MYEQLQTVVKILKSSETDLRELAILSGRDPFRFYNGADFKGADLSGQNLTSLNFDLADLRSANLDGVTFDRGCFNRSVLREDQKWLKDKFEYTSNEVISFPTNDILLFSQIRPGLIDSLIDVFGLSYSEFASKADVSAGALRKSRQGKVVAIETAQAVFAQCDVQLAAGGPDLQRKYGTLIDQPCASLMGGGNNRPFFAISHSELERLMLIRKLRIRLHQTISSNYSDGVHEMRDTASYLEYYEHLLERDDLYYD